MIAGATPMPAIPSAASLGTAATNAESGTISNAKRAIEGIVCRIFKIANIGPCKRGFLAAATPSGKPITTAAATDAPTSAMCCISASANTWRWLSYSRAIDSASKVPVAASTTIPAPIAITVIS